MTLSVQQGISHSFTWRHKELTVGTFRLCVNTTLHLHSEATEYKELRCRGFLCVCRFIMKLSCPPLYSLPPSPFCHPFPIIPSFWCIYYQQMPPFRHCIPLLISFVFCFTFLSLYFFNVNNCCPSPV